jgi:hypothetical protein
MMRREEHKERVDQGEPFIFLIHPPVLISCQNNILMKFDNGPKATRWPSILGEPNSWSWGRVRSCRLNIKIILLLLVSTPSVKALGPISKIQPMGIKDLASKRP